MGSLQVFGLISSLLTSYGSNDRLQMAKAYFGTRTWFIYGFIYGTTVVEPINICL